MLLWQTLSSDSEAWERGVERERDCWCKVRRQPKSNGPLPLEYIMPSWANALLCPVNPSAGPRMQNMLPRSFGKPCSPRCLRSACACQDLPNFISAFNDVSEWVCETSFARRLLVVVQLVPETHTLCFWSSNAMNVMFCACLGGFTLETLAIYT